MQIQPLYKDPCIQLYHFQLLILIGKYLLVLRKIAQSEYKTEMVDIFAYSTLGL